MLFKKHSTSKNNGKVFDANSLSNIWMTETKFTITYKILKEHLCKLNCSAYIRFLTKWKPVINFAKSLFRVVGRRRGPPEARLVIKQLRGLIFHLTIQILWVTI